VQVRAARRHPERVQLGRVQSKCFDNVVADASCGGSSETDYGNVWKFGFEKGKLLERGPEVVAPFADAVSFIDGYASEFALAMNDSEDPAKVVALAVFRGDI